MLLLVNQTTICTLYSPYADCTVRATVDPPLLLQIWDLESKSTVDELRPELKEMGKKATVRFLPCPLLPYILPAFAIRLSLVLNQRCLLNDTFSKEERTHFRSLDWLVRLILSSYSRRCLHSCLLHFLSSNKLSPS